ncbi:MAG: hypothetical protein AAFN74_20995, partial [Myxococcota bacterium]
LLCGVGASGCSSNGGGGEEPPPPPPPPPTSALPSSLRVVASAGFERPLDAVTSHDGATFYFTAIRPGVDGDASESAVFAVASAGGTPTALHAGLPLGNPTGLVMSCDGSTLYVADMGLSVEDEDSQAPAEGELPEDSGALYTIDTQTGQLTQLSADGIGRATGIALNEDCSTLYVTGWTPDDVPAVFTVGVAGGTAQTLLSGAPLTSPTGIHVDTNGVAWVMDHEADGPQGTGVLFSVSPSGQASVVVSDLEMGMPGGVSLDSTGQHAVMPTVNEDGEGQLTAVTLATGEVTQIAAPMMRDPAGIRTARNMAIFAVVDADANRIYAAE